MPKRKGNGWTRKKKAKNNPVEEDCPPSFNDDDWLGAFQMIDHDLLNNFSRVSKGSFALSEKARSIALKCHSARLHVRQIEGHYFQFNLNVDGIPHTYLLELHNQIATTTLFKKVKYFDHLKKNESEDKVAMSLEVIKRSRNLIQRFEISDLRLTNLIIDNNILKFIKANASSPTFDSISLTRSEFDNEDDTIKERFRALLHEIHLKNLSFFDMNNIIDHILLQEFTKNNPQGSICYYMDEETHKEPHQAAPLNFMDILLNMRSVILPLLMNPDGLVLAVQKRLRAKLGGRWHFYITRPIQLAEYQQFLESDMKFYEENIEYEDCQVYTIRLDSVHSVTIDRTPNSIPNVLTFEAFFQS